MTYNLLAVVPVVPIPQVDKICVFPNLAYKWYRTVLFQDNKGQQPVDTHKFSTCRKNTSDPLSCFVVL